MTNDELSNIDVCDLADWELSVEKELTFAVLPELCCCAFCDAGQVCVPCRKREIDAVFAYHSIQTTLQQLVLDLNWGLPYWPSQSTITHVARQLIDARKAA